MFWILYVLGRSLWLVYFISRWHAEKEWAPLPEPYNLNFCHTFYLLSISKLFEECKHVESRMKENLGLSTVFFIQNLLKNTENYQ